MYRERRKTSNDDGFLEQKAERKRAERASFTPEQKVRKPDLGGKPTGKYL